MLIGALIIETHRITLRIPAPISAGSKALLPAGISEKGLNSDY
jgi:hypothetical protein